MPTECERSGTSLEAQTQQQQQQLEVNFEELQQQQQQQQPETKPLSLQLTDNSDIMDTDKIMEMDGEMSTSQTSNTSSNGGQNGSGRKTSLISPDPTAYVAKARVTRPTPPPPSYNPMQFVQIKPCNLYQTAQQQLKKAEEVKKIKEIKKEEPEDWQCNLDNWKSSRRKRVEHIIDRVVEVKKLELEEHDRSRRKSKTFSEMIEERGERGRVRTKLASLAVYNEDESNDLSDLGIGTSSASGKSSQSEDYDNNSVMSDNADLDKAIFDNSHKGNHNGNHNNTSTTNGGSTREYISSPGYDTSSSTAPASSPDPCEYTYEGAIQDYKQRVSRASSSTTAGGGGGGGGAAPLNGGFKISNGVGSKESTPERAPPTTNDGYPIRRGSKIEDRLIGFEVTSPSDNQDGVEKNKIAVDVPKIDISKRKEIFESQKKNAVEPKAPVLATGVPKVTLKDRFKFVPANGNGSDATDERAKKDVKRLSGDITSIRERLQNLEQQQNLVNSSKTSGAASLATSTSSNMQDMPPVAPLKDRLSSLQNAVTKEVERKPPVSLIDARQLEIMQSEEETAKQRMKQMAAVKPLVVKRDPPAVEKEEKTRDDSGIHIEADLDVDQQKSQLLQQEDQLNAAIAALAIEEKQLEAAANAVNQIEAEFAELSATNSVVMPALASGPAASEPSDTMEFSINEALELALEAIDKETTKTPTTIIRKTQMTTRTTVLQMTTNTIENEDNDTVMLKDADEQQQPQQQLAIKSNLQQKDNENNRTDEEKELKTKLQQQQQLLASNANDEDDDDQMVTPSPTHDDDDDDDELPIEADDEAEEDNDTESKISKEPIYENISAASTYELDTVTKIIPNNKNNNNNNNNEHIEQKLQQKQTLPPPLPQPNAKQRPLELPPKEQQASEQTIATTTTTAEPEPYYQVPKSSEPYYDAPKHVRPVPLYENIDVFYNGLENSALASVPIGKMEPPKEKPPPPPADSPPLFDDDDGDDEDNVDGVGLDYHNHNNNNNNTDTWSSENTYETISSRHSSHDQKTSLLTADQPSPPIKRMNSTKRIKKELRSKRSSFLGIEGSAPDDEESYLEYIVAPPPDMAQLLQEERRLEKQLYMKAGLCDSSDTGESRDSGVSENHSRQSSEPYTNSSEELERHLLDTPPHSLKSVGTPDDIHTSTAAVYQHADMLLTATQTPQLLQTVKGDCAESWTESATAAAAASKSLTEATATANAKMMSIEEKIREQEEVLRVERELLQLEQEELKRQRENLMLRENMARRELQHGAKMLMSANRRSLQDLNGTALLMAGPMNGVVGGSYQAAQQPPQQQQHQHQQQIYANVPQPVVPPQHSNYYQVQTDYRKSLSDLNEFSKRLMIAPTPPTPPSKPLRTMQANGHDDYRRHPLMNTQNFGGSLVKIATSPMAVAHGQVPLTRGHIYSNYHHQSVQNLSTNGGANPQAAATAAAAAIHHGNMTRNTLHALSATPKPKYTDGWVQVQNRKSYDATNLANDPAWLSAYQQKRKSMPDAAAIYQQAAYNNNNNSNSSNNASTNNHWLVQEAEQRRLIELQQHEQQQQRRSVSTGNTPTHRGTAANKVNPVGNGNGNGKPLPDSIIQSLTERVQSKGIGERKRFDKSPLHTSNYHHHMTQTANGSAHHHQHQSQPTAAHRHFIGGAGNDLNATQTVAAADSSGLSSTQAALKASTPPTPGQDKVLSVSGKKKCSHCGDELGRGAAMIIESLLLFYHINCFKCCVCHVQLGDGLNGTDVRVRNHKLHCQNCYSSDDGIKFSCV